jgi:hypothetical protein
MLSNVETCFGSWGWFIKNESKHVATLDKILNKSCVRRQFCVLIIEIKIKYVIYKIKQNQKKNMYNIF